jgi:hypothetical protein
MKPVDNRWYRVPEVWLMIVMLVATMAGSLALVGTAFEHRDDLLRAGPVIAAPLPPSSVHRPAPATRP